MLLLTLHPKGLSIAPHIPPPMSEEGEVVETKGNTVKKKVSITKAQDEYTKELIERGEYNNFSELVRDAIRELLKRRVREEVKEE